MAKQVCLSCGKEMGFFNSKVPVSDGFVCMECWMLAGFKSDMKSLMDAQQYTGNQIKSMNETLLENVQVSIDTVKNMVPTAIIANVLFDDVSQQLAVKSRIPPHEVIRYGQVVNFELLEDGDSVTSGGVGRALVGGALFGTTGAIVGGVTGAKRAKTICTSLKIKVTVRDYKSPAIYIPLIEKQTKTDSPQYKQAYKDAQDILSMLQLIADKNDSQAQPVPQSSSADEIRKFKQLLDEGIITEDEFSKKKRELLGL